ncbi:MAG: hypothetical protein WC686_05755 [Candidatus Shapirobacteria bacterium]|jgi:hypothetical protein
MAKGKVETGVSCRRCKSGPPNYDGCPRHLEATSRDLAALRMRPVAKDVNKVGCENFVARSLPPLLISRS